MGEASHQVKEFNCTLNSAGLRLDAYLVTVMGQTRSQIKNLIDSGQVLVDNNMVKAGYKLKGDEKIIVTVPKPVKLSVEPVNLSLDIVYQDSDLIVINKTAGLVVHPGAGNWENTMVHGLLYHCRDLSGIGGKLRPGIVHRLDKDTTGLIVIAKNDQTHQILAAAIKAREVKRHYLALVHGTFKEEHGTIDAPIGRHPKDRKRMAIVANGREARTHFTVKEVLGKGYSLVECRLESGRTHQIRVHMASINHPVVGDQVYGPKRGDLGCKRQMLHAYFLGLNHPRLGWMEFSVQPPQDFQDVLQQLKKE